jgi:hypothetical protein
MHRISTKCATGSFKFSYTRYLRLRLRWIWNRGCLLHLLDNHLFLLNWNWLFCVEIDLSCFLLAISNSCFLLNLPERLKLLLIRITNLFQLTSYYTRGSSCGSIPLKLIILPYILIWIQSVKNLFKLFIFGFIRISQILSLSRQLLQVITSNLILILNNNNVFDLLLLCIIAPL